MFVLPLMLYCVGADAVLSRPLYPRAVLAQVKKLIQGRSLLGADREIAVGNLVLRSKPNYVGLTFT